MAQRIFIASDQLLVCHLFTLLEQAGISVLMQKSVVDVPQEETGPLAWYSELWVLQNHQLSAASQLLEDALVAEAIRAPIGQLEKMPGLTLVASRISSSSSPPAEIA
ncbi:hypothetical protein SAMN04487965_2189 [Microbulbifer donghaiensis]|uniref:DUF2007 domain-containing protein n=1 Tax=Microbulbifer donghaiensis TaxID=494016 RepID=A0A1M5CGM8_9GAMM|nr:hypothetical protein [Microbulbifer donghaiensis]SHF53840.1 hypothetical protein SAMN04487965_2189 [Microbulbifer donghaiensis]